MSKKFTEESSMKIREMNQGLHMGQRKLFVSLLLFLNKMYEPLRHLNPLLVYVGSGHATGTSLIHKWFPSMEFHLFDPEVSPTDINFLRSERVTFEKKYFTREDAEKYEKLRDQRQIFFVSDIRSLAHRVGEESELAVTRDMQMQREWVEIIKPTAFQLKFRTPFDTEASLKRFGGPTFKYLDGHLALQAWAPPVSAELRLIGSTIGKEKEYNFIDICSIMHGHNERRSLLVFGDSKKMGFDEAQTRHIVEEYAKKCDRDDLIPSLMGQVNSL